MESSKSCLKCCVTWVFCAVVLLTVLSVAALGYAGRWLQLSGKPRPANAIIVLAGSFQRSMYAADLYRQHYAPKIYLSVPAREAEARQLEALGIVLPYEVDIHRQILQNKGVPARDILIFGVDSVGTAQEAEMLRREFSKPETSLLVVTSPYHTRRSTLILDRAFAGTDININVVATPYEEFREDWWRSQDSARNTLLELAKIAYFYAGGQFRRWLQSRRSSAAIPNATRP